MDDFSLASYDYALPPEQIAQEPAACRDASRLMVLDLARDAREHCVFRDLPELFRAGDVLALNDTRVFPARFLGRKASGGKIELFLLGLPEAAGVGSATGRALLKSSKRAKPGARLFFGDGLQAEVREIFPDGSAGIFLIHPPEKTLEEALTACGRMPLPPYIGRETERPEDRERYQTCYARESGSVAAPTAGLHFTPELLRKLAGKGVRIAPLTLHVGYGTFAPVRCADIREHKIHREWVRLSAESAEVIAAAKREGRRVWAVGTTSARTLEFAARRNDGLPAPYAGPCDLYIVPGFRFRVVDNLITNFHLPQSSLLFLVSALAGRERILAAYREAVSQGYRFFSYGDAMAIVGRT